MPAVDGHASARGDEMLHESIVDPERPSRARESAERTRRRPRKAPVAAFWSFVFPGGGQLYNHQRRLAAAFGLPILVLIAAAGVFVLVVGERVLPRLLDSRVIIGLLAANGVLLVWRLAAMLQAHRRLAPLRPGRTGTQLTALLVLVTLVMHAVPTVYGFQLLETLSAISLGGERTAGGIHERFPAIAGPSGQPLSEPSHQPEVDGGERVTILLVGIDSGADRDHALTDTMLVVSIDPRGETAMLSIPRDLVDAPLPNGEPYPFKLNSLMQNANADPAAYPFGGGAATLKATIAGLLDVPIHYFAAVDMAGFRDVIDAIGGIEVDVTPAVADPVHNLYLEPGLTYMHGDLALTYVRSRFGEGNDDFVRAARQQQVVTAVRNKLTQTNLLTALPGLLDAVQNTIATDVPSHRIPELAQAVQDADPSGMEQVVIQPPTLVTPAFADDGAYVLVPDLRAIQRLAQRLMGD